jgi:hypothetical protein
LWPNDADFLEGYNRIRGSFAAQPSTEHAVVGTLRHLIETYRASPEFLTLETRTRKDYSGYLDILETQHGHRSIATTPREAVFKLRDEFKDTPRKANYIVSATQETARLHSGCRSIGSTQHSDRGSCARAQDIGRGKKSRLMPTATIGAKRRWSGCFSRYF